MTTPYTGQAIRLNVLTAFPRRVASGAGVSVTKVNGVYTFSLNVPGLLESADADSPDDLSIPIFNEITGMHEKVKLANFPFLSTQIADATAIGLMLLTATDAGALQTALGAAGAGANSDITSLSALTTALSVAQGGTGATTAPNARAALGAAASGVNNDVTSLTGMTTPLSVAQGGTGDAGSAWTTYTPTVTAFTGTFGSASATGRFKRIGQTVFVQMTVTITSVGTATTGTRISLPVNADAATVCILAGRENVVAPKMMHGIVSPTNVLALAYDSTSSIANGAVFFLSGVYQAA